MVSEGVDPGAISATVLLYMSLMKTLYGPAHRVGAEFEAARDSGFYFRFDNGEFLATENALSPAAETYRRTAANFSACLG